MRKILYIITDFFIAALLAGAYMIQYYTKRKLGMNRWVVYKTSKIKEQVPAEMLRYAVLAAVLVLMALLIVQYGKRRRECKKTVLFMVIMSTVLSAGYLAFVLVLSEEDTHAYYLMLPLIVLAGLIQIIKTFLAMRCCAVLEERFDDKARDKKRR